VLSCYHQQGYHYYEKLPRGCVAVE
jgi:hypothetical protein